MSWGGALGSILGGFVMDKFGGIVMFRGIAILVAITLLLHLIVLLVFRKGHDRFLKQVEEERLAGRESSIDENVDAEEHDIE
jgi:predicted lipid-binding transport protein (Tim44 family)